MMFASSKMDGITIDDELEGTIADTIINHKTGSLFSHNTRLNYLSQY